MTGTIIQAYTKPPGGETVWMVLDEGTLHEYIAWWSEKLCIDTPDDIAEHFEWEAETRRFVDALVRAQVRPAPGDNM